jgi:Acetyltransferase (GNAT) family
MMDSIGLRKAALGDQNHVLAILDEAAGWLNTIGVEQWPFPFPRVVVQRDFEQNTVWLASIDGEIIATASILLTDPLFWGDLGRDAWHLHRFAVRRHVAGVGRTVLSLIEHEAVRSGVESILPVPRIPSIAVNWTLTSGLPPASIRRCLSRSYTGPSAASSS